MTAHDEAAATQIAADTIATLRKIAGRTGTVEILKALKEIDVYKIEPLTPYPMPMAFNEAYGELLDVLIQQAEQP